jgi:hypothetical protein
MKQTEEKKGNLEIELQKAIQKVEKLTAELALTEQEKQRCQEEHQKAEIDLQQKNEKEKEWWKELIKLAVIIAAAMLLPPPADVIAAAAPIAASLRATVELAVAASRKIEA